MGVLQAGSGRFTDRSVSNSLARVHGFAQRKVHHECTPRELRRRRLVPADDEGQPLLDAATGEEVARVSATGVDLGAMTDHARVVGGPAIRALTFHERAGLLKAVAKHLTEVKDELYALSYRTGATKRDSMVDIDGGIGTVFSIASKGTRELPNDTVYLDGGLERLGREGTFLGQHVYTSRPGVAVQINAFNFPVWGMLEKLAPAFLAGLPTIVKPASQTAYLTELVVRRILEAGLLPDGALQLLCGSPAGLLEELRAQDSVAFTGSAHTGAHLRQHPSVLHGGVQLGVEADSLNCSVLGPDVTSSDPEFDLFVKGVVTEMTVKAGQKCTAIRRVIVPAGIAGEVTEAIAARLAKVTVGNPADDVGADGRAGVASASATRCARLCRHCADRPRSSSATPTRSTSSTATRSAAPSCRRCCCAPPTGPTSRTTWSRSARSARCSPTTASTRRSRWPPGAAAAWSAPSSRTTPTSRAPWCSAWRRGTAGSWCSTATTRRSPRATDRRCRCWCTADPAAPAAARSSAASAACSTTCSAARSRPRPTCSPRSPAAGRRDRGRPSPTCTRSARASRS